MHYNVIKTLNILSLLFLSLACTVSEKVPSLQKSAADVTLRVIQPFAEDKHLATVEILKINDCKIEGSCKLIPLHQEVLAYFIFTHYPTEKNENFKALSEHFPGVKSGSVIRAYIITEYQKHGKIMTTIFEYSILD